MEKVTCQILNPLVQMEKKTTVRISGEFCCPQKSLLETHCLRRPCEACSSAREGDSYPVQPDLSQSTTGHCRQDRLQCEMSRIPLAPGDVHIPREGRL